MAALKQKARTGLEFLHSLTVPPAAHPPNSCNTTPGTRQVTRLVPLTVRSSYRETFFFLSRIDRRERFLVVQKKILFQIDESYGHALNEKNMFVLGWNRASRHLRCVFPVITTSVVSGVSLARNILEENGLAVLPFMCTCVWRPCTCTCTAEGL